MKSMITVGLVSLICLNILSYIFALNPIYHFILSTGSILLSLISIYIPISYEFKFSKEDWNNNDSGMSIYISSKAHKMGNKITCELYEMNQEYGYQQVLADVFIENGNILIKVGQNGSFDGKAIIRA